MCLERGFQSEGDIFVMKIVLRYFGVVQVRYDDSKRITDSSFV